ncbi:hypothetical protein SLOPH_961 [Spraguea lophii 42_110]|uniref:Uncharacterized protein n=1 Tax=Spraguea lophii (strain 42_110) TaxID=1358809 RepID=S7W7V2_SPRLO|nr:hypothetical protein SLOPH_961 [Spraguea lophii 42_110]
MYLFFIYFDKKNKYLIFFLMGAEMLSRNRIDFIYENEKNFDFFIKLYKNIKLLGMIKIRKLAVFCLIYFMNIQASNISNRGQETNIEDVLIKIQRKNGTKKEGEGIICDLGYKARSACGKSTELTINSLEYSGVKISNITPNGGRSFANLKLNDEGKLEGKGKNDINVSGNEIMIVDILFYANITIDNNIINTFIDIMPEDYLSYNDIDNDIYEMKPYQIWVYLRVDSNGGYSGKNYDDMAGLYKSKFFKNYKLFTFDNKISSIEISNFKNAGYIYYPNINSQKFERIAVKPETSSERDINGTTKPETISDGKEKEVIRNLGSLLK